MPFHMGLIKNKTYSSLLIKPRFYVKNNVATFYWIRKDRFYGEQKIESDRDGDQWMIGFMETIKTPEMKKLKKKLWKIIRYKSKLWRNNLL